MTRIGILTKSDRVSRDGYEGLAIESWPHVAFANDLNVFAAQRCR